MTTIDPAGYSEAGAHLFTWLADKVLGGAKKAFGWGWEQVEWAKAQDRYDARIIQDYGQIRILTEHLWNEDRGLSFRHEERRPGEQLLTEGSKFYILGKPGAGKTTFLKHLAVREAQRGKWGLCLGKIPIFVSLKQFGETSQSLFDFIVTEFAVCGFPDAAPFVETLLKEGKALVLFDGLDEVSKTEEHDRRGEVTQMLAQFARQYGDCHIVVTCRIAAVDYTFEPAFTYLEMADFAPDQVEAFVRAWFWDESDKDKGVALAEGMLAALELPEHKGIRDLSRNPLLLTLLCLNYAETLSFPARRVEIYEEALDALLKKWDSSRRIQRGGLYKTLSLGRKRQMFARIAFDAMARGEVILAQADLERRLVEYLANVPELPEAIDIDGEAVLREIVAQHGIFVEQARGLYSFAHLTFQEYFAARHIADSAGCDALDVLLSHTGDDKWREVFLLTVSVLPDATAFLSRFEDYFRLQVISCPAVIAWLNRVRIWAAGSKASYRQPATRYFIAMALTRAIVINQIRNRASTMAREIYSIPEIDLDDLHSRSLTRIHNRSLDLVTDLNVDLTLAIPRRYTLDRVLDGDLQLALSLANALTIARNRHLERSNFLVLDVSSATDHTIDICKRQERTDLYAALVRLTIPEAEAPLEHWLYYVTIFEQIVETSGFLDSYERLQAEVEDLVEEQGDRWTLSDADFDVLKAYIIATQLFYDCLRLAYTPDRSAFEDRIFLPPS